MTTGTFPSKIEAENDLFGESWLELRIAVGVFISAFPDVWLAVGFLVSVVEMDSCRSCAHGRSVGSAKGGTRLHEVRL